MQVHYIGQNVYEEQADKFIVAAVKIIFKKDFLPDNVSFKHEEGRIYLKNSKILKCLEG